MYVLCSPCILNPALRADGITHQSDLEMFRLAIERCRKFGIEMVPLPCPETKYLGSSRKPGTFLERLNTSGFAQLLDDLTEAVHEILEEKGAPLFIIGVNSSPTCGVTSTYYGSDGDLPPKRAGRGVFLSRFGAIPAIDVGQFSCYRVYLAAPLFSEAERNFNEIVARSLRDRYFYVHLPQEVGDSSASRGVDEHARIYRENLRALEEADMIIAIIDGADADSGTAWEMGYAKARGKRIIALRTDFRLAGINEKVNLMLEQSATVVNSLNELLQVLGSSSTEEPESGPAGTGAI